jgi:FtsZ-binding cell division protein ZapB
MVKRSADASAKLSSLLWSALGYLSKKRVKRDLITAGESTKVDVLISGTIGRSKIEERVNGSLTLSEDQTTATSTLDTDAIVALLLAKLDSKAAVMQEVTSVKESTKALPAVSDEQREEAKQWLARLRSSKMQTKAGAMVFAIAK